MDRLVLKNCSINGCITDVMITDGKISIIGRIDEDGTDLHNMSLYPGLVDIHCHGVLGYDTMDGDKLAEMSEFLLDNGTTSWYPTTMTMDYKSIKNAVKSTDSGNGANVLGFHMEGPYINKKYKGAQNESFIKAPDIEEFNSLDNIKIVTIAPELEGSLDFIKNCNCVVALGHTCCSYDEAISAIESGANCLTHTFNAMPPLHHREPALIGAAMDKDIYVQAITDGIHLHPAIVRMLYRMFGKEKMIIISDAMKATGLPDGVYEFGGQDITVKDKIARTSDGALAGSTSTLMACVRKAVEFGIPKDDAFYMATTTPATLMNINKGRIKEGFDADLIAVDDNLQIKMTILNGKIVKNII